MRLFSLMFVMLVVGLVPMSAKAGPRHDVQRTDRIQAELVSMSDWAAPGSTAVVAIRQVIQPGWHTYWRNPGDSGGATTLTWAASPLARPGAIVWPLPQRQRLESLVNYGYQGEVFLPVPVEISPSARPGSIVPLKVKALFLVCSDEMCVPDELTLSLDLPIRDGAAPLTAPFGRRIETTVETAPRPAGIEARIVRDGQTLRLSAAGGPLAGAAISSADFFPFEGDVIDHAAAQLGQRGPAGVTLELAAAKSPPANLGPISGVLATDAGAWEITATPGAVLAGTNGGGALKATEDAVPPAPLDLWSVVRAMGLAFVGGLILNLMPCVFPVLAMKVAALAGSAHEPRAARRDGLMFTLGVLVTFVGLAAILLLARAGGEAVGWGFQLQSPGVVAGLALLMLAVGLNLSGVFEIGGGLQGLGGSRVARLGGSAGAFFTGVLAVVVAAPCTAPFMALALGAALVMPAPLALIVFAALGLGMALPYLVASLSPRLLARLPRPGPWMDRLRRGLAIPMYAATLWLIWVFARQTGTPALALLGGAIVATALGLWLLGRSRANRLEGRPSGAGISAAVVAALIVAIGLTVTAVSLPVAAPAVPDAGALNAQTWSPEAVAAAQGQGRVVLVDFTADWCVSCKINERTALSSPRVAAALKAANGVFLKADWTRRDDVIARELARHGRSGVPLYLVYRPGDPEPRILPQLLTEGLVVDALAETAHVQTRQAAAAPQL